MAILFDLDGTLLDSAHDIWRALNVLLEAENKPPVAYDEIRPWISFGGKKIVGHGFKLDPDNNAQDQEYAKILYPKLLDIYSQSRFHTAQVFPGINELLTALDTMGLKWGIVTNKTKILTEPLLQATGHFKNSACLVCGDTTSNSKPHPEPLLHACKLLNVRPQDCLYIGDSATDVQAGKAAGMRTMAVEFGYIPTGVSILDWQADYVATTVAEILPWIKKWSQDPR